MTSEIEKMYKLANLKAINIAEYGSTYIPKKIEINGKPYPPFTAEKQLELIKFLMDQEDFSWTTAQQGKNTEYAFYVGYEYSSGSFKEFTEALAGLINEMWQNLTEEEKQQVKGILE